MLSWSTVSGRLGAVRRRDLEQVEQEARNAEAEVADLEDAVRRGEPVEPGQVEAAEARGRHVRLRLDGVAWKHDRELDEAHAGWAGEVHAAATDLDDDPVFDAVKSITRAVVRLSKAVPEWNERFGVVLDAARQVSGDVGVDVGVVNGGLRIDGRTKLPVSFSQLIHQAIYDGVGGDHSLVGDGELWGKAVRAHQARVNFKDRARTGI